MNVVYHQYLYDISLLYMLSIRQLEVRRYMISDLDHVIMMM